ncbi:hypothetical protein HME7025_00077 [Aquirufa nivalisilvae]|uniref:Uncharacterized protein n=1 Tax=Aquirufa nivalisilvae TaxID=2516557 RepID=A0A2S2DRM4_9BACT|nr:hypothetical protein [Aquirufa nivalisilvae]AWL07962.1 hypothetical protein HME7025_00077 [Aquirufa nivalisilvae]
MYYSYLNKNVIVLHYGHGFKNWYEAINPSLEIEFSNLEGFAYIVDERETIPELKQWLESNYESIFSAKLLDWCPEVILWPQNRSFQMFAEWFDISYISTVMEVCS